MLQLVVFAVKDGSHTEAKPDFTQQQQWPDPGGKEVDPGPPLQPAAYPAQAGRAPRGIRLRGKQGFK